MVGHELHTARPLGGEDHHGDDGVVAVATKDEMSGKGNKENGIKWGVSRS